jgi:hypothetical protein
MSESLGTTFEAELSEEKEKQSDIVRYWKKFNFPGTPPNPGTPAEKRLFNVAQNYFDIALMCERNGNPKGSSAERRELHNQLALMIFGIQRTDMDIKTAEKIADFTAYITNGSDLNNAIKEILEFEKNKQYN